MLHLSFDNNDNVLLKHDFVIAVCFLSNLFIFSSRNQLDSKYIEPS